MVSALTTLVIGVLLTKFIIHVLDPKHLINRFVEELSESSLLYAQFTKELHGAITGKGYDNSYIHSFTYNILFFVLFQISI